MCAYIGRDTGVDEHQAYRRVKRGGSLRLWGKVLGLVSLRHQKWFFFCFLFVFTKKKRGKTGKKKSCEGRPANVYRNLFPVMCWHPTQQPFIFGSASTFPFSSTSSSSSSSREREKERERKGRSETESFWLLAAVGSSSSTTLEEPIDKSSSTCHRCL